MFEASGLACQEDISCKCLRFERMGRAQLGVTPDVYKWKLVPASKPDALTFSLAEGAGFEPAPELNAPLRV